MPLISPKKIQRVLRKATIYHGKVDGLLGPMSSSAVSVYVMAYGQTHGLIGLGARVTAGWTRARRLIAMSQILFKNKGYYLGSIDGLHGPNTEYALELWQNADRDKVTKRGGVNKGLSGVWPTYNDIADYYGPAGSNLETFEIPYPLRLAWDVEQTVTRITMNTRCKYSVLRVFEQQAKAYSETDRRDLGLDLYGGSFNLRKMRGGSRLSTHAYGCALDFNPLENPLRATSTTATFAEQPEYDAWWRIWEAAGWVSLGREKNYDWMHVQACRF